MAEEPGPGASDAEIDAFIRREYGYQAWVLDDSELARIIRQAVREGRDETWVDAQIRGTAWFRAREPSRRDWIRLRNEDPGAARQALDRVAFEIQLLATRAGVTIMPARIRQMAEEALLNGWASSQGQITQPDRLQRAVVAEFEFRPSQPVLGDLGAAQAAVLARASEWMVPMAESTAAQFAARVLNGDMSEEGLDAYLRDLAMSRFEHLADHIRRGITPTQFFEPYRQEIARLLETTPDAIDLLNDPRFAPVVDFVDEAGKRRPMTLSETQMLVRGLDDWQTTRQANEEAARVADGLGRMFGMVA